MMPDPHRGVIIPSYNSGPLLESTVRAVLETWRPVVVVVDGSTDGSEQRIRDLAARQKDLRVISHPVNRGKGAAVLTGLEFAHSEAGPTPPSLMPMDNMKPPTCPVSWRHPACTLRP